MTNRFCFLQYRYRIHLQNSNTTNTTTNATGTETGGDKGYGIPYRNPILSSTVSEYGTQDYGSYSDL